jgi:hypothetical protein
MPAEFAERPDHADRDEVLAGEDRRGRVGAGEEIDRGAPGGRLVVQVLDDGDLAGCNAGRSELLEEPASALLGGADGRTVAEVREPAVPALEQVPGGEGGAVAVVADHGVGGHSGRFAVDEDHGRAASQLRRQVRLTLGHRGEDEAVDAATEECRDRRLLTCRVVVEAGGEHRDAPAQGHIFDRPVNGAGEGVVDAADEQAERARPAVGPPEVPRVQVGLVVQGARRCQYLRGRGGGDIGLAVDDARDGLHADARERGDVPHGRPGAARVICRAAV